MSGWLTEASDRGDQRDADQMLQYAIELIARIQAATNPAYEMNSVASRLAFDQDKLSWELNYFFDHFFVSLRQHQFRDGEERDIKRDLQAIAADGRPKADAVMQPGSLVGQHREFLDLQVKGRRRRDDRGEGRVVGAVV